MAGKTTKKNKSKKKKSNLRNFFLDEKFRITMGLLISGFSILLLLALISYLFTWKVDQSFNWEKVFSNPDITVENWSGKTGAYFANLLINKGFGIASFFIPLFFLLYGLQQLNIHILNIGRTLRIGLTTTILLSITLGVLFHKGEGFLGSGPGGQHGYYLSEWLHAFLGKAGTIILLIIAYFTLIVFSSDKFYHLIKAFIKNLFAKKSIEGQEEVDLEENGKSNIEDESNDMVFETEYSSGENERPSTYTKPEPVEEEIQLDIEERATETTVNDLEHELDYYDPTLELSDYQYPEIDFLNKYETKDTLVTNEELVGNKNRIVETLSHYNIKIDKIKATIGPAVTLYEIVPAPGIRISKIKNLEDDIALSLAALGIRIIAPMPGKGTIGIEVPNQTPEIVSMRSLISSRRFQEADMDLAVAIGKTISNETFVFDLTKMPHLLVAGATGQGKSVGLNVIIASLLYKKHPSQIKFVLIDPKKVELTIYAALEKHFLAKLPDAEEAIITDTQKVVCTLKSLIIEMESRYNLFKLAHVRNVKEYNNKFINRKLNPEKGHRYLPYIIIIIDEFADFIMTAGKEVEAPIARLAQLARAVGLHLIIATQRPTTNIITGTIKANFPARIAYRVTSMIDSRTILDTPGANQLIGRGDMLFSAGSEPIRLQCGLIDIPEIEKVTSFIGQQRGYPTAFNLPEYVDDTTSEVGEADLSKRDELFDDAARLVVIHQQGSTSLIQRKFSIGYNRAGRIIDQLEAAGIVGPFEGSKARQVLFPDEYALEQYLNTLE